MGEDGALFVRYSEFSARVSPPHVILQQRATYCRGVSDHLNFVTPCDSLLRGQNRGFVVSGFLAALHIFAWLGFHKYVPRDQHTDDVFPLCSVLFFLCWLSTRLMSQGGNENIVTQLRKEIGRASI